MKYRIRCHFGKYYIEVEKTETKITGALWWIKLTTETKWVKCASNGQPVYFCFRGGYIFEPLRSFDTLQNAKDQIKIFLTPDQYFDL